MERNKRGIRRRGMRRREARKGWIIRVRMTGKEGKQEWEGKKCDKQESQV